LSLPAPGTDWPAEAQEDWLNTAKGIFKLIYNKHGQSA
jgi:uncharacterized LabA/DUF88 family protein